MNRETLAAIDIGSNAIRLLINYVELNNYQVEFKKAGYIRVPIRLGEDVFTCGRVREAKRERMVAAMIAFQNLMKVYGVRKFRACATSAMREAKNGAELVELIRQTSGIDIEIISGDEEAKTIYEAGDMAGLMNSDQSYLYVDVGGGSTEVTIYSNKQRVESKSFPLGTVRLLSNAVGKDEMKIFKEWLKESALPYKPVAIIGSGGNINRIYKILSNNKEGEPLKYNEVKAFYDQLKKMSFDERITHFKINAYRADVIMPATKIYLTAAKCCGIDDIIVPRVGLVDGIIHKLYYEEK